MYNSQEISNRIKTIAKKRGISLNEMLKLCGLSINTVSKMSKGSDILTQNFAKIADVLDCSVDYLLGRTDSTKAKNESNQILNYFNNLNEKGQDRLLKYAIDLSKVDEYKKCDNSENMNVG